MQITLYETVLKLGQNASGCHPRDRDDGHHYCTDTPSYHETLIDFFEIQSICEPNQALSLLVPCLLEIQVTLTVAADNLRGSGGRKRGRAESDSYRQLWSNWKESGETSWESWRRFPSADALADMDTLKVFALALDIAAFEEIARLLPQIYSALDPHVLGQYAEPEVGNLALIHAKRGAETFRRLLRIKYGPGSSDDERKWYANLNAWLHASRTGLMPKNAAASTVVDPSKKLPPSSDPTVVEPARKVNLDDAPDTPSDGQESQVWVYNGQPVFLDPDRPVGNKKPPSEPEVNGSPGGQTDGSWSGVAPQALGGPPPRNVPIPTTSHPGFGPPGTYSDEPAPWLIEEPPQPAAGNTNPALQVTTPEHPAIIEALTATASVASDSLKDTVSDNLAYPKRTSKFTFNPRKFFHNAVWVLSGTKERIYQDIPQFVKTYEAAVREQAARDRVERNRQNFLGR